MKKHILPVAIIALMLAGVSFAYLILKENPKTPEKSTKDSITELFSQKYNRQASDLIIGVLTDTGKFAKGTVNFKNEGGGIWLAAKTEKGWELASSGNGIVPCADIEKYNFPKDMVPACRNTQNGNELIQR